MDKIREYFNWGEEHSKSEPKGGDYDEYVAMFWEKEEQLVDYGWNLWERGLTMFYKGVILATAIFFLFLFYVMKRTQRRHRLANEPQVDTTARAEVSTASHDHIKTKIISIQPRQEMKDGTANQTVFVQELRRGLVTDRGAAEASHESSHAFKGHTTHTMTSSDSTAEAQSAPGPFGTDYAPVPTGKVIQPTSQLRVSHAQQAQDGQPLSSHYEYSKTTTTSRHQHADTPEHAYRNFGGIPAQQVDTPVVKPEPRYAPPPPPPPPEPDMFYNTKSYRAHHEDSAAQHGHEPQASRSKTESHSERTTTQTYGQAQPTYTGVADTNRYIQPYQSHEETSKQYTRSLERPEKRKKAARVSYEDPGYQAAIASVEAAAILVEEAIAHQPLRNRLAAFAERQPHRPTHAPHNVVVDTHDYRNPTEHQVTHRRMTSSHHEPRGHKNREYRREYSSKQTTQIAPPTHEEVHREYSHHETHQSAMDGQNHRAVVHEAEPYRPPRTSAMPIQTKHEGSRNYNRSADRSSHYHTQNAFENATFNQRYEQNGIDPGEDRGLARMIVGSAIQKKREVERPAFRSMYNNPVDRIDDERFKRAITDIRYASGRLDEPMSRSYY